MASDDDGVRKHKSGSTTCEWTPDAVFCLLEKYGEKYAVGRGLLRNTDWEDVVQCVNTFCRGRPPKTVKQCRDKIDSLKKRYKTEKTKSMSRGIPSTWPFFKKMDEILSSVMKTTMFRAAPHQGKMLMTHLDMRGGRNGSEEDADEEVEEQPNSSSDRGDDDPPSTRGSPSPDSESGQGGTSQRKRKFDAESSDDESDMPNQSPKFTHDDVFLSSRKKIKQLSETVMRMLSRRSRQMSSNPVQALADAIVGFSDVYARIELAKMEIYADMQLELAKIQRRGKNSKVPCTFSDSEMQ